MNVLRKMDQNLTSSWNGMELEDFATFEGLLGLKVVKTKNTYWRQVRPFFFRPLVIFKEYHHELINVPLSASMGGFQYAVGPDQMANSFLNFLVFENPEDYSVELLDHNRKRQVRLASKQFEVRPIDNVGEFKEKAYPIYLSFYERTRYEVGSARRHRHYFYHWADAIFQIPNLLILGGFRADELHGVSLSMRIDDTVVYATFFSTLESLRLFLSDLMLHSLRAAAAACPHVKQVFLGIFKGNKGLDDFYLLRGAKVVRKRAKLHIRPIWNMVLKHCMPTVHSKLLGSFEPNDVI